MKSNKSEFFFRIVALGIIRALRVSRFSFYFEEYILQVKFRASQQALNNRMFWWWTGYDGEAIHARMKKKDCLSHLMSCARDVFDEMS